MNVKGILSCGKMHDKEGMTSDSKWRKSFSRVTIKLGFELRRVGAHRVNE